MFVRRRMNRYYFILELFISMRDSVEFTRRARSPEKACVPLIRIQNYPL